MHKYSPYKVFRHAERLDDIVNGKIPAPVHVRIKPTNRCTHKCWYCPYQKDLRDIVDKRDEIPISKLKDIITELYALGTKAITLSGGGEPLLYKHIEKLLDHIVDLEFDLGINTNGQFMEKYLTYMWAANWIRVSMDYWDEDSFEKARGVNRKHYYSIIQSIRELTSTGTDVGINFIITQGNFSHLEEVTRNMKESGASNIRFSRLMQTGIDDSDFIRAALSEILRMFSMFTDNNFKVYSNIPGDEGIGNFKSCLSQIFTPVIGADLNVYRCHYTAYTNNGLIGNIRDIPFADLWYSEDMLNNLLGFNCQKFCSQFCPNNKKNQLMNDYVKTNIDNFV